MVDQNIKNILNFLPVKYADIDPSINYYNNSHLEQKINEIKSMNLEEEFGRKSYEYQVAFSGSQGF